MEPATILLIVQFVLLIIVMANSILSINLYFKNKEIEEENTRLRRDLLDERLKSFTSPPKMDMSDFKFFTLSLDDLFNENPPPQQEKPKKTLSLAEKRKMGIKDRPKDKPTHLKPVEPTKEDPAT